LGYGRAELAEKAARAESGTARVRITLAAPARMIAAQIDVIKTFMRAPRDYDGGDIADP
jgi:hypothetical protein